MIPELAYLLFFAGLAGIVQGTVGFGFGLVAMSTLPLWMDIKEAVPVVALLCLVVNATLTWRLRAHLSWSRIGPLLLGSLAGVPAESFIRYAGPKLASCRIRSRAVVCRCPTDLVWHNPRW